MAGFSSFILPERIISKVNEMNPRASPELIL